jgi:hypothetical protein
VSVGGNNETGSIVEPSFAGYIEGFLNGRAPLSPSFRLGVAKDADWTLRSAGSTVKRTVARFDGCPLRWIAAQPWADDMLTAQPCVRLDVGQLELQGDPPSTTGYLSRMWVSAAALLRVRWVLRFVFFEAELGATFPVTPERFPVVPTPYVVPPSVESVFAFGFGVLL